MGYWGGGRGGGRGGHNKESNQPWYEVVRTDRSVQERPTWNLTCYGYKREGANDVVGDISPEEVRYANMLSSQQGVGIQGLKDEFRTANRQRVDLFQGLAKGKQAPSQVGGPLQGSLSCIRNLVWIDGSASVDSGIGKPQIVGGFGQQSTATGGFSPQSTATGGFGQQSTATGGFGQPTTATGGFGQQSTTTGGFGQPTTATGGFGQHTTATGGFGQPTTATGGFGQQSTATGGFGQPTTATGGFGQPSTATGGFGQPTTATGGFGQQSTATGGFGQQTTTAGGFGQQPQADLLPLSDEEAAKWNGQSFDKGKIPSTPPPRQVC